MKSIKPEMMKAILFALSKLHTSLERKVTIMFPYDGGLKLVEVLICVWQDKDGKRFETVGEKKLWLSRGCKLIAQYTGWDKA